MRARIRLVLFAMLVAACGGDDPPPVSDAPPGGDDASTGADAGGTPDADTTPDAEPPTKLETECDDGLDNDGDGDTDCDDAECVDAANCVPEADCMDTIDNDLDGLVDCEDDDCSLEVNCIPEAACMDGLDDDLDGLIDCDDDDCAAAPNCNPEADCGDTVDNDLDTFVDCDDSDCAADCTIGCPAGTVGVAYSSTDVPIMWGTTNATSTLSVAEIGLVVKAGVRFDAVHTWDADVDLFLVSPAGTSIDLTTGNGGSNDNFSGTLFLDSASVPITAGTAPFAGTFRPETALATVNGEGTNGDWVFQINDNYPAADNGTVNGLELFLCYCVDCEVGATECTDGLDNNMDGLSDCADPTCEGALNCIPETDCNDSTDNDLDMLTDCQDLDCNGIDGCENPEVSCADAVDNDMDSATDCDDADCDGVAGCEFSVELTCDDAFDNDSDGLTDCADTTDCATSAWCSAESNCTDGLDNDMDGATDCSDFGCAGALGCEPGGEVSCNDGFDNDSDGAVDCADSNCAGSLICVTSCPSGSTATHVVSTDVPLAFGAMPTFVSSEANVATVGVVTKVAILFDITHTWDADVDLRLRSPAGTLRDGTTGNGGGSDNYIDTILIDTAATAVTAGTAPFTGQFRPEQAFTAFNGQPANGNWALEITDNYPSLDNGNLTDYQIVVCSCNGTPGCEFGAACNDGMDNDGDSLADCTDSDCAMAPNCLPESICNDGLDNDSDGEADCLDSDCNGINGCQFGVESNCTDMFDNDGDGQTDCSDANCAANPACATPEVVCNDGIDNEMDGLTDCADTDCYGVAGCEIEPNGTTATATNFDTVSVNGRVFGRINPAGDQDHYQFVIPAGSDRFVSITTFSGTSGDDVACSTANTNTFLLNSTGATLFSNNDMMVGSKLCSHIGVTLAPGTYFVRVQGSSLTATFSYQLAIRSELVPVAISETEPNEDGTPSVGTGSGTFPGNDFSTITANGPYSTDTLITAAINPAGDEDVFSVTNVGVTAQTVFLETSQTTGNLGACTTTEDTQIRVRDAAGAVLAFDDDSGLNGFCSFLAYTIPAGATVYVHIIEYGDNTTIPGYRLFISTP